MCRVVLCHGHWSDKMREWDLLEAVEEEEEVAWREMEVLVLS